MPLRLSTLRPSITPPSVNPSDTLGELRDPCDRVNTRSLYERAGIEPHSARLWLELCVCVYIFC